MYEYANDKRRLWKLIIFGFLTLGIYDIYFFWTMFKDLNRVCSFVEEDDDERSPNYLVYCLLTLITLGIYHYLWYYKQGNRMKHAAARYGFQIEENGSTYILWQIFGALLLGFGPIISLYLFLGNLNKLARTYNHMIGEQADAGAYDGRAERFADRGAEASPHVQDRREITSPIHVEDIPTTSGAVGSLMCLAGYFAGASFQMVPGEEMLIGRNGAVCNIVLQDQDISRKHCSIRFAPAPENAYYVTDYSTLGTWLNDSIRLPKGQTTKCPVGSKLTLGNGNNIFMFK